jgi:type IV pilus assembly protein PilM
MMANKKAPSKRVDVGLDLTSNELRCVALSKRGKEITLERFAIGDIPASVFAAGRVAEPAELGARIKAILGEQGISARRAYISLSGKAAITRIIELPKMGAAQTRTAISLQINQYVPFPPGDTVYDYRVLPPREGANASMQEVLLVATRSSTVKSLIETLQSAGIEADGIKITSLAAWNLIEVGLVGYSQAVGIIDLRDTVTDLCFFLNGTFRLSRPVELGYESILAKVAQLLGVTRNEAEEYLRAEPVDLTIPEDEIDPTEDNRMREALLSVFSSFVSDLIRSIRYYESQAQRSERVGKLLLFGNVLLFPNLAKYLEDQTGLEVSLLNLSSLVQYRQGVYSLDFLNVNAAKLPVAGGLALEAFKKKKELNLMPAHYYVRSINATIVKFALLIFAILGCLGYYYYDKNQKIVTEKDAAVKKLLAEAEELRPDAEQFDQVKGEVQQQLPRYHQVFNLFKQQRVWPVIMTELGNRINDRVWVEDLDMEASSNTLKLSGYGVDRVDIIQFAINLDKSPFFTNTKLEEKTSGSGSGGSGGGGGGTNISSRGGMGGGASAPDPRTRGLIGGGGAEAPMQDYKLPRFDFTPGATIEDFFRNDFRTPYSIEWKFEVTTTLQDNIVDQSGALTDVMDIEEVIENVVNS